MKLNINSLCLSFPMFGTTSKKMVVADILTKVFGKRIIMCCCHALYICIKDVTREKWFCGTKLNGWHWCYPCNLGIFHPMSPWLLGVTTQQWLEPIGCILGACLCLVSSHFSSQSLSCDCFRSGKWGWFTSEAHTWAKYSLCGRLYKWLIWSSWSLLCEFYFVFMPVT